MMCKMLSIGERSGLMPIRVVSSANFRSLTEGSLVVQSFVYREKSSGGRTQPWGAPVLIVRVLDENFPSLTTCCLSVGKLVIHWQTEVGMESCVSLFWTVSGMIVKSWAEVYKQDPHIRPWFVQMLQDEVQSLALKVNCRGSSGVLQISQNQSFKWLHDHRR